MDGNPTIHHGINAAVVAAPVVSWWAQFPEHVTLVVGCLAAIYYMMVIVEKASTWYRKFKQLRQSAHRVGTKLQEERHGDAPPPG